MKNSDRSEDCVCQTFKCYLDQGGNLCWVGMNNAARICVDFPNFAQGFGFASREAIFEVREFPKTDQVGFRQGCDTGVVITMILFLVNK